MHLRFFLGICQQRCTNLWGSYRCHCRPGFRLSSDGRTCIDVDECRDYEGLCIGNCVNEPGSYRCTCPQVMHNLNELFTTHA